MKPLALLCILLPLCTAAAENKPAVGQDKPALAEKKPAVAQDAPLTGSVTAPSTDLAVDAACEEIQKAVLLKKLRLADDEFHAYLCALRGNTNEIYELNIDQFDIEKRLGPDESLRQVSISDLRNAHFDDVANRMTGLWALTIVPKADLPKLPLLVEPRLGSNPLSRIGNSHSMHGHYEATRDALALVTARPGPKMSNAQKALLVPVGVFPPQLHLLMQDASQDADYYDWSTPAAHAQAACHEDGDGMVSDCPVAEGADCAKKRLHLWLRDKIKRARAACGTGQKEDMAAAMYWVGYALHGVEDLAPHRGRTNCEHAYNAYGEHRNPDELESNYKLAVDLTARFLFKTAAVMPKACLDGFASVGQLHANVPFQPRGWKKSSLGEGWGLAWGIGLLKYRFGLADRYAASALAETPVRWFHGEPSAEVNSGIQSCVDDSGCMGVWNELEEAVFSNLEGNP